MSLGNPEIVALVSALGGGVAVKILDYFISRSGKRMDEASVIRKELREEIKEHKKEIERAEQQLDDWQQKYFELLVKCREEATLLRAEIEQLRRDAQAKN